MEPSSLPRCWPSHHPCPATHLARCASLVLPLGAKAQAAYACRLTPIRPPVVNRWMTSRDASLLAWRGSLSASPLLRLRLSFPSSGSRLVRACTKHLSGILIGASFLPLRVPETHRFPHSSNQNRAGSGSSWLRARARGRARRRSALRRPANVRRGGGSPIKANGCRAWSKEPLRASWLRRDHRSSDLFRRPHDCWLCPWFVSEPAPVRRRDHPPPLLSSARAGKRSISKARSLVRIR